MSTASFRPRVLVIAEAANPEWVSVPLVGWSMAQALGEVADIHLVTQIRNREAILRAGLVEGQDFTAIDSEAIARPLWKLGNLLGGGKGKGWTISTAVAVVSYPYFEHLIWKAFGDAIRAGEYDIVHRVTPLSPITVSPIAAKCAAAGIPFVMGPLNGGVPWPKGFEAVRKAEGEWLSRFRDVRKLFPGRNRMLKATRAILAGSRQAVREVPAAFADRTVWLPENAIDTARFNRVAPQNTAGPLRACFIGRLVPCKGVDMLIEAAAPVLTAGRMHLDIVGDGPERGRIEALVSQFGLGSSVTFHGMVDHHRVQDLVVDSNVLTFPSIRDFGGGVVLEAMALGVVPIVVDYAGPGELVVAGTGYKIPISSRDQIVADLRRQLERIVADPGDLPAIGACAREHVLANYTWSAKAHQVREVYDWVLGRRVDRPDFAATQTGAAVSSGGS
ncbi:glycosyltransferase family 4 protein [Rhodobacteraceae bacterium F11138]|nr:glycosyltransferase family 4 protein [Rhodobacteraceae bacterium F11138]